MLLTNLCDRLPIEGADTTPVTGIATDTRQMDGGELFVARPGASTDGHRYLGDALEKGAAALLIESHRETPSTDVPVLQTANTRQVLPDLLKRFFGDPSDTMNLIGVTGTNGKTTTTYLLHSILEAEGESTGLIGTIEWRYGDRVRKGSTTTPSVVENFRCLQEWREEGATAAVMEVSSHGLDQGRVEGLSFSAAGFTNLTQDHLDYHEDMEDYFQSKSKLFDRSEVGVAFSDGTYGERLSRREDVLGVGDQGDYRVEDPRVDLDGVSVALITPGGDRLELESPLTGRFNYKNVALAAAVAHAAGVPPDSIRRGIRDCEAVPGRCERISGPPDVVIDYAHTPAAMENVLEGLDPLVNRDLICVFGAGGDRDRGKRPKMGRVAVESADYSVVTSDNPRSEDPDAIIDDILEGMNGARNYHVQSDRGQAIREAIERADEEDLVVIVGKGHETEQVIGNRVIPFEDKSVAREVLRYLDRG